MPEIRIDEMNVIVIPKDPSFMSDKEFLRAAEYQLVHKNHLPLEWQEELVKRLDARVRG